jgi:hypothetical protein
MLLAGTTCVMGGLGHMGLPPAWHWTTTGLGVLALLTAGGLLLLKVWAEYLAYVFAAGLSLSWVYAVWQVSLRGWPYSESLGTVLSLVPGNVPAIRLRRGLVCGPPTI